MFERFTERARQVIVLAQEEALMLKHNYIGTEHILLGLLREAEGPAARALESLGITVDRTRAQVVAIVGQGSDVASAQIPFTPRAKKVLDLGIQEADRLGDRLVATHHLLLGLLREGEGVANRVMADIGGDPERLRALLRAGLEGASEEGPAPAETLTRISRVTDPAEGAGTSPAAASAVEVCSFCGQRGSHMFASFPRKTDEASICDLCLDVYYGSLSQYREKGAR